jgi:riboflavin transporter FmnP
MDYRQSFRCAMLKTNKNKNSGIHGLDSQFLILPYVLASNSSITSSHNNTSSLSAQSTILTRSLLILNLSMVLPNYYHLRQAQLLNAQDLHFVAISTFSRAKHKSILLLFHQ